MRTYRHELSVCIVELEETFYGMREFIIRDINRFLISFGQLFET